MGVVEVCHDDVVISEMGLKGLKDGAIGDREEEWAEWVTLHDAFGRVEAERGIGENERCTVVVGPLGAPIETGCVFAKAVDHHFAMERVEGVLVSRLVMNRYSTSSSFFTV